MNKFTWLIFISIFATLLSPKQAQAQWQTPARAGFEAIQFCMRSPSACYGGANFLGGQLHKSQYEEFRERQEWERNRQLNEAAKQEAERNARCRGNCFYTPRY